MSDKKFNLPPEQMERLRVLLREEEARVDAVGDDEAALEHMEQELQRSLRKLAADPSTHAKDDSEESQRHWQGIEAKMNGRSAVAEVLPLRAKPKRSYGAWIGAFAAAAAALFVLMPRLQQPDMEQDPQFAVKGIGSGAAWPADCELKLIEAPDVKASADGMGYDGPVGAGFQLAIRCDQSGFVHVRVDGPEPQEIRNLPVLANETTGILQQGKLASFALRRDAPWVISAVLSVESLSQQVPLVSSETEAQGLNARWFDRITVKGILQ